MIDNVFDKVMTTSVKDNELTIREQGLDSHAAYEIFGPVSFRNDQQIFLELYATTHSYRN